MRFARLGLLGIIAERIRHVGFVLSITLLLVLLMVRKFGYDLLCGDRADLLLAHLKHGVNRVIILDIDLHHGTPLFGAYLITLANRSG